MKRFSQLLLAWFACLHLCGGPLGMMQVVAWSGMLVSYSQESGVASAVKRTFDGLHPCRLCEAVAETRKHDSETPEPRNQPQSGGFALSKDFAWSDNFVCPAPVAGDVFTLARPEPHPFASSVATAPAVPPPRLAA